eukprot:6171882-Alexandrium_andersonii.AAC.1
MRRASRCASGARLFNPKDALNIARLLARGRHVWPSGVVVTTGSCADKMNPEYSDPEVSLGHAQDEAFACALFSS